MAVPLLLASVSDLAALVDDLDLATTADVTRATVRLRQASALVRDAAGQTWLTEDDPPVLALIPEIAWTITLEAAKRGWDNPSAAGSTTIDDFTERDIGTVMLTEDEVARLGRLRPVNASGLGGLGVISTTRDDFDPFLNTTWIRVEGQDESQQFPLYPSEGPIS